MKFTCGCEYELKSPTELRDLTKFCSKHDPSGATAKMQANLAKMKEIIDEQR